MLDSLDRIQYIPPALEHFLDTPVTLYRSADDPVVTTVRQEVLDGAGMHCVRCGQALTPLGVVMHVAWCDECEEYNDMLIEEAS